MLAAVYACQVTLMNRNLAADSYSSSHLLQLKLRLLWCHKMPLLIAVSAALRCIVLQVRRMFTAVGREVVALHRAAVGGLSLGDLPSSEWKYLSLPEVEEVFAGPSSEDIMGTSDSNSTGSSGTSGATSLERRAPSAVDEDEEEGQQVAGEAREPVAPMPKKVLEDEKRRRRTQALKKMVKNM